MGSSSLLLKTTANSLLRCGVYFRSLNWRRGVCTASGHEPRISSSSSSPWLMLSPRWDNTAYTLYNFGENRIWSFPKEEEEADESTRIVGSSHGWLALYNRGELFLSNPLSGRRINLPPVHNLPNIPEANLGHGVEKLIISSSDPESEDCRALMSFGTVNSLAFCCPGRRGTEWTIIGEPLYKHTGRARYYEDFVYCAKQQLFFAVTYNLPAELEAWDLRDPLSPRLVWSRKDYELMSSDGSGGGRKKDLSENDDWWDWSEEDWWNMSDQASDKRKYLVASGEGEVFYVIRYINPYMRPDGTRAWDERLWDARPWDGRIWECTLPAKTIDFDINKIATAAAAGEERMDNGQHHNLDGRVMFLGGVSHGLVMHVSDALGYPPSSICFTNDAYGLHAHYNGHDHGIFDLDKKTISSCYYPCDYHQSTEKIVPPPMWFTPTTPLMR